MSNGATKEYKFGTKNNWRRWMWNRIVERLRVKPNEAVCLYLAGKDDLDRVEALRRGFRPENMIAVDRSATVVEKIRDRGGLVMQGDFLTYVNCTSWNRPVHVVVGDFCCDAEDHLLTEICGAVLYQPAYWDAVWAFNFQRGRGARLKWLAEMRPFLEKLTDDGVIATPKHRGVATLNAVLGILERHDRPDDFPMEVFYSAVLTTMQPDFSSYRSGSALTFDSVVFSSPLPIDKDRRNVLSALGLRRQPQDVTHVRRMAAAMAHRAMRIANSGPYGAH